MPQARYELKYYIDEATADIIRDYARAFVLLDKHADPETFSYPINSLYFDSDDLTTFWATLNGQHHRYKLRIRTYDDRPDSPVFFEIKRGVGDTIVKERGAVRRGAVEKILAGWLPEPADLVFPNDHEHYVTVENFVRLMRQIDAKPKAYVRYLREAWVGRDDPSLRFTMDREVGVAPKSTVSLPNEHLEKSARPFGTRIVLEMKFSGEMPTWFADLQTIAGLHDTMAAKYCGGILMHDEEEFSPVDWPVSDPARNFAFAEGEPAVAGAGRRAA